MEMLNICSKLSTSKMAKVRALCSSSECQYFPNPRWIGSLVAEGCLTVQSGLGLILGLRVSMIHGGAQPSILFTKPECCQTTMDMQIWKEFWSFRKKILFLHANIIHASWYHFRLVCSLNIVINVRLMLANRTYVNLNFHFWCIQY